MVRPRLSLLIALVALLAACGGSTPSGSAASPEKASPGATGPASATAAPAASEGPDTSDEPAATGAPAATDAPAPTDGPVESVDPTASVSPSAEPGAGAAACSGSAANREFLMGFATAVDWPVLCAVLPKGWFVAQGSYRLANGGKLLMSYKGPSGARIALTEGAYCLSDAHTCTPSGTDLGPAMLGPLAGTLFETADGFAIVVAPGENPGWLKGLDQATTTSRGAALAEVGR